jgi:hypothetical protein
MRRIALLIGAPGWENQTGFLPGVKLDIINYQNFLLSPTGGAWQMSEIVVPPLNPHLNSLLNFIGTLQADYVVVIFSGHGSVDMNTGQQLVNVNPRQVVEMRYLVPAAPKGLVLVDACRVYQGAGLSGLFGEDYQSFSSVLSPVVARQYYEQQVAACVPGWTTLYACQPGQTSQDTSNGGNFSSMLLNSVNAWVHTPSRYVGLPASTAFKYVEHRLLEQRPFWQQPQLIITPTLAQQVHQFPFALRKPIQTV